MFRLWRRLTRAQLLAEPFPEAWRELVLASAPLTLGLSDAERTKLEALIRIFLAEKEFEGAGGLELSDEMRVAIAARACLLVLHRTELDGPLFEDLAAVVVYPSTYRAKLVEREGQVVIEGEQTRLGESWQRGVVVLAWDSVQSGGRNPSDGHDVVLHEFAHQLDAEDGEMDGTPELDSSKQYANWAHVLGDEFRQLQHAVERRRKSDIDRYAAKNPAEFFAVVSEAFFEKPMVLEQKHPELYAEFVRFYHFDPAELAKRAALEKARKKR